MINNDNEFEILNLLENAFDFLESAILEFEDKLQYSVVHFVIAIELILKSRLLFEHWALIVDGEPCLKNFKTGNFKSIDYTQLIKRIRNTTSDVISDETEKIFKAIASERNKIVHFIHPMTTQGDIEIDITKEKMKVAIIELSAWEKLKELLEGDWFPLYSNICNHYEYSIDKLSSMIAKLESYYQLKYESIKADIIQDIKNGRLYRICPNCKQESSRISNTENDNIKEFVCRVCGNSFLTFEYRCLNCEKKHYISIDDLKSDFFMKCDCSYNISLNDILISIVEKIQNKEERYVLLNDFVVNKNNYFDNKQINCANCDGYNSVVRRNDIAICVDCGKFQCLSELKTCEYCGEQILGEIDISGSGYFGCPFCDGANKD